MEPVAEYAITSLRFLLAVVFLVAATGKLLDRKSLEKAVRNYKLVPEPWAAPIAAWLPPVELAASALLFAGVATGLVAAGLAVMLAVFAGAVAVNLLRGREIDCGCFSTPSPKKITWLTVARNVALAAAAVTVAWPAWTGTDITLAAGEIAAAFVISLQLVAAFLFFSEAVAFREAERFFRPVTRPRAVSHP